MSNFKVLESKLTFLRDFYERTTHPFREIKRKIEVHEEPYIPYWSEEPDGEPPFLSEWMDANDGLRLQEQVCLNLLQRSFREFLDGTAKEHCDYPNSKPKEKGNWFENYQKWFYEECAIDWTHAPVSLSKIEELTFARNCVQHGGESHGGPGEHVFDSHDLIKRQSLHYHQRFPDPFFGSEIEKQIWSNASCPNPVVIELTVQKLDAAIDDISTFCQYIHEHLPSWVGR